MTPIRRQDDPLRQRAPEAVASAVRRQLPGFTFTRDPDGTEVVRQATCGNCGEAFTQRQLSPRALAAFGPPGSPLRATMEREIRGGWLPLGCKRCEHRALSGYQPVRPARALERPVIGRDDPGEREEPPPAGGWLNGERVEMPPTPTDPVPLDDADLFG